MAKHRVHCIELNEQETIEVRVDYLCFIDNATGSKQKAREEEIVKNIDEKQDVFYIDRNDFEPPTKHDIELEVESNIETGKRYIVASFPTNRIGNPILEFVDRVGFCSSMQMDLIGIWRGR
jgi:hypothetical protein